MRVNRSLRPFPIPTNPNFLLPQPNSLTASSKTLTLTIRSHSPYTHTHNTLTLTTRSLPPSLPLYLHLSHRSIQPPSVPVVCLTSVAFHPSNLSPGGIIHAGLPLHQSIRAILLYLLTSLPPAVVCRWVTITLASLVVLPSSLLLQSLLQSPGCNRPSPYNSSPTTTPPPRPRRPTIPPKLSAPHPLPVTGLIHQNLLHTITGQQTHTNTSHHQTNTNTSHQQPNTNTSHHHTNTR